ncbi:hypothetical protein ACTYWN_004718 [Escherichia coli]|uniref:hypothetical protein n=1 Tax=Escherichia coli TaxID=562 RepID=UPI001834F4A6|nr:hypothetical protein [Escherichia coli]EFD9099997.1 hypothetical protein [Escherichia coli]EFN2469778.1 hypothetical protein [Escherichia coli]EGT7915916.1 hypothetical protein [Escherichia coli]EIU8039575.1 hypothetical protein [Escherichia coli]EIW6265477.1 hypothetical protein [Escherichia coli]
MFMPIIQQYEKDPLKAQFINVESHLAPVFFIRWIYKKMYGTKLDSTRAAIASAAFAKDPRSALKSVIEQYEMQQKACQNRPLSTTERRNNDLDYQQTKNQ